MPEPKNWKRHAVEIVVIVGSILLAFGIEAWWDRIQERETERQQLSVLRAEMVANRSELDVRRQRGAGTLEAQVTLIELIGPESQMMPVDSLASLLRAAWAHALHALRDVGQVVLLELGVRCKKDDRLSLPVLVV